jgi:hypothetical protein
MNHDSYTRAADRLVATVKNNPEGLLLLAAGAALLLRSGNAKGWSGYPRRRANRDEYGRFTSDGGHFSRTTDGAREYASDLRDTMTETARDYADAVTETASSYASAVGDYASETGRTIADRSSEFAGQAQETFHSTMDSVLEKQPLAVALAGFAAGAAIAAAFPTTAMERRTLGPTGDRLTGAASRTGRQMRSAASAAGERLMSAADERGLNAEGLKDLANDIADEATEAFDEAMAEGSRVMSSSPGKSGGSAGSAGSGTTGASRTKSQKSS